MRLFLFLTKTSRATPSSASDSSLLPMQQSPPLQHPSQSLPPPSQPPLQPGPTPPPNSTSVQPPAARPQPSKEQLVAIFKEKLISSGEKSRLKDLLNSRLTEVKWKAPLVEHCHGVVGREGLEKVTLDMLVAQTVKLGRDTVPQHVKAEMMEQIRKSLSQVQRQG